MRLIRSSVLLLTLLGCGDRATTASGEPGGTIVIPSQIGIPTPTFPLYAEDPMARLSSEAMFDRLADLGPELNTVGDRGFTPRLARSWEWSRDSLSIAFAIDPRARWHDGRPVRAGDVRFAFNLAKNPKAAAVGAPFLGEIDSVSVRDSLTAVVWYRQRSAEQLYTFVYNVWPLPEHLLKDIAPEGLRTSTAVSNPVGSGRFRFERSEPGTRLSLIADTANYRGRPKLDRVIIATVPDPGAALAQLFGGQGDFLDLLPPDALTRADSTPTLRTVQYPNLVHVYLGFNQRDSRRPSAPHPLFGDVRLRRAIAMALDRESMLRNVFGARGLLARGPAPRAVLDTSITLPPFDRARAAALLDSAGWRAGADGMRSRNGQPLAFSLAVPASSPPRLRYAVLIQEQLRTVGIRVTLDQMDFPAFIARANNGRYDAAMHGRSTDPSVTDVRQSWATSGFPPAGQNWVRYSSRTVDALADSLTLTVDPARIGQMRRQIFQTIVDDAPGVWLYDLLTVAGMHSRLRFEGSRPDAWWAGVSEWWIPANERIERDRIGLATPATP